MSARVKNWFVERDIPVYASGIMGNVSVTVENGELKIKTEQLISLEIIRVSIHQLAQHEVAKNKMVLEDVTNKLAACKVEEEGSPVFPHHTQIEINTTIQTIYYVTCACYTVNYIRNTI